MNDEAKRKNFLERNRQGTCDEVWAKCVSNSSSLCGSRSEMSSAKETMA
jgi:hypothetical protein